MLKFTRTYNGPRLATIYINPINVIAVEAYPEGGSWLRCAGRNEGERVDQEPDYVAELITKALSDNPIERRAAIRATRAPEPA